MHRSMLKKCSHNNVLKFKVQLHFDTLDKDVFKKEYVFIHEHGHMMDASRQRGYLSVTTQIKSTEEYENNIGTIMIGHVERQNIEGVENCQHGSLTNYDTVFENILQKNLNCTLPWVKISDSR